MNLKRNSAAAGKALPLACLVALVALLGPGADPVTGTEEIVTLHDHASDRIVRLDIGTGLPSSGLLALVDPELGLVWTDDPLTVDPQIDGSVEIEYDGAGHQDEAGTLDPMTGVVEAGNSTDAVSIEIEGSIGEDRVTGEVTVTVDTVPYTVSDTAPPSGEAVVFSSVVEALEGGAFDDLYDLLDPTIASSVTEYDFVTGFESLEPIRGELIGVDAAGSTVPSDNGLGWDLATTPVEMTFDLNSCIATYDSEIALVYDDAWYLANIGPITPDIEAPTSSIDAISPIVIDDGNLDIPITSADAYSGVCDVSLSARQGSTFGAWSEWGDTSVGTSSPIGYTLNGPGDYQFYSRAVDAAGNAEAAPADPEQTVRVLPTYADATLALDPVPDALWMLDESAGTTAEDLIGSADGTYQNGVDLDEAGPSEFLPVGVHLDGNDDALSLPPTLSNGSWTLELWVRFSELPDDAGIIFAGDDGVSLNSWGLYGDGDELTLVAHPSDSVVWASGANAIVADRWMNITIRHFVDEGVSYISFLIDGVGYGESYDVALNGGSGPLRFGFEGHATNASELDLAAVSYGDELGDPYSWHEAVVHPRPGAYRDALWNTSFGVSRQWPMDPSEGTAIPEVGGGQDGEAVNGATIGAGGPSVAIPNALNLDGVNDYVSVADPEDVLDGALQDPFAWSAWVKGDAWTNAVSSIVGKGAGAPLLYVDDEGYLTLAKNGTGDLAKASQALETGTWHFVVACVTESSVHLYVDGTDLTGDVTSESFVGTEDALGIGSATGESATSVFDGSISSVALSGGFTSWEVANIYRFGRSE
jgi:concanavalin A-like lectin/glucanase superfamily protein